MPNIQSFTIVTPNFKFNLDGFIRTIENIGGYPIIKYSVYPYETVQPYIRWSELYKIGTSLPSSISFPCKQTAEILVIGETIHFSDMSDGAYFSDRPPFVNVIPSN